MPDLPWFCLQSSPNPSGAPGRIITDCAERQAASITTADSQQTVLRACNLPSVTLDTVPDRLDGGRTSLKLL